MPVTYHMPVTVRGTRAATSAHPATFAIRDVIISIFFSLCDTIRVVLVRVVKESYRAFVAVNLNHDGRVHCTTRRWQLGFMHHHACLPMQNDVIRNVELLLAMADLQP
jgi:hypothetical protein